MPDKQIPVLSQINEVSASAILAFIAGRTGHTTTCNTLHYLKTKPGGNDHAPDISSAEQKQNPPDTDHP